MGQCDEQEQEKEVAVAEAVAPMAPSVASLAALLFVSCNVLSTMIGGGGGGDGGGKHGIIAYVLYSGESGGRGRGMMIRMLGRFSRTTFDSVPTLIPEPTAVDQTQCEHCRQMTVQSRQWSSLLAGWLHPFCPLLCRSLLSPLSPVSSSSVFPFFPPSSSFCS